MGTIRPSETPRDAFVIMWAAIWPCMSTVARCGGFSPRSTIARERAPHARVSSALLCKRVTSNPAPSKPRRVSSGVERKLVSALPAQGVG